MKNTGSLVAPAAVGLLLAACAPGNEAVPRDWANEGEWRTVGLDYEETRYSPLDQIDTANVDRLRLAWSYVIGEGGGQQEATPLVADGVMYSITNWSITFAIDAANGRELWRYDPRVDRSIDAPGTDRICCGVVNRGVGLHDGKVFVPVIDGRMEALDAASGERLWSTLAVPPDSISYTLTMAPRVVKDMVIVGVAGAEYPPFRGYFAAFDVEGGSEVWRFYTVPGNPADGFENTAMEEAAETWTGEWWEYGGGGSVWDGMAYDQENDLFYVGIGNPTPWPQEIRQGMDTPRLDNLYVSSIVAVDPDNGELVWYYQTTPGGDDWDFDAVQHLMLADLRIDGRERQVIMQANKNGVFYVLDRVTGEFISAEPFALVNWMSGYDHATGRPSINTDAYYSSEQGVEVYPSAGGAHSWAQMAFSPNTGLVYMPVRANGSFTFTAIDEFRFTPGNMNLGLNLGRGASGAALPPPRTPPIIGPRRDVTGRGGILSAWDPVTQTERWYVDGGGPSGGGVLATAGDLVFQVIDQGGMLRAIHAGTGKILREIATGQTGNMGPPMTYMIDGVQYVALMGGAGQGAPGATTEPRLYAYRLDGNAP